MISKIKRLFETTDVKREGRPKYLKEPEHDRSWVEIGGVGTEIIHVLEPPLWWKVAVAENQAYAGKLLLRPYLNYYRKMDDLPLFSPGYQFMRGKHRMENHIQEYHKTYVLCKVLEELGEKTPYINKFITEYIKEERELYEEEQQENYE